MIELAKYIYVPKKYELLISQYQASWLLSAPKAYTIVTGVYTIEPVYEPVQKELSNVLDQAGQYIPRIYTYYTDTEAELYTATLHGFCLEAKLSDIPVNLPTGCIVFDTSTEFLDFLK